MSSSEISRNAAARAAPGYACFGLYTYAQMECEASCAMRKECRSATGENVRHAITSGVHEHVCDGCGKKFAHQSQRTPPQLLCADCDSTRGKP